MECGMNRFARQSFLGANSDSILHGTTLGLVGLGGGGSHLFQQAAHVGFGNYVLADGDTISESNTNRLVGGTLDDARRETPKIVIAERIIRSLVPDARITVVQDSWHNATDKLKRCDIIIGAVDSFMEREQLERFARRHLIPYIDIGMDVHEPRPGHFLIAGQIILSLPGKPCLRCCGFINDERIGREADNYGAAGGRPQVVWPNGVLASTAIGIAVQLVTPWFPDHPGFVYLEYDGNRGTVTPSVHMRTLSDRICPHHPANETGDPLFDIREYGRPITSEATTERAIAGWRRYLPKWLR
jgi:hypothetical protein